MNKKDNLLDEDSDDSETIIDNSQNTTKNSDDSLNNKINIFWIFVSLSMFILYSYVIYHTFYGMFLVFSFSIYVIYKDTFSKYTKIILDYLNMHLFDYLGDGSFSMLSKTK